MKTVGESGLKMDIPLKNHNVMGLYKCQLLQKYYNWFRKRLMSVYINCVCLRNRKEVLIVTATFEHVDCASVRHHFLKENKEQQNNQHPDSTTISHHSLHITSTQTCVIRTHCNTTWVANWIKGFLAVSTKWFQDIMFHLVVCNKYICSVAK